MKLSLICRICLKERKLSSIFEIQKTYGKQTIFCSDMLNICTAYEVKPSDGYPQQLCNSCLSKLWAAYKFRRLCEESYEQITSYILENKINTNSNDEFHIKSEEEIEISIGGLEEKNDLPILDLHQPVNDSKDDIKTEDSLNFYNNEYDFENDASDNFQDERDSTNNSKKSDKFSCKDCSKIFKYKSPYEKHKQMHLDILKTKGYICNYCFKICKYKATLVKHMTCHSNKETKCSKCSKVFKNKIRLLKHEKTHDEKPKKVEKYECSYCSKILKSSWTLTRHQEKHKDKDKYYCYVCKKFYSSIAAHKACSKDKSNSLYQCDHCGKSYKSRHSIVTHLETHNVRKKTYICEKEGCGKVFNTICHIKRHKYLHEYEKAICHICSKELANKGSLKVHLRRHSNQRTHPCSYCDRKFYTSSKRSEHERRHTNVRNYGCKLCDKRFVCSSGLKRHMLIHEGAFNEHCRFCEKRFIVRGNRYLHERLVHGVPDNVDESKFYSTKRFKCTRLTKVSIKQQNK